MAVVVDMSVSLDGHVTGPNDDRANPFGDGAQSLHDWFGDASTQEDRDLLAQFMEGVGSVVMGRRSFDKNEGDGGWGAAGPAGDIPCFVVTHAVPAATHPPVFTFVTDGVEAALEQARRAAGTRNVYLFGATVMQQLLPLGLVDILQLHVVPVLIGGGTKLFSELDHAIELERTGVLITPAATHLTYQVKARNARG